MAISSSLLVAIFLRNGIHAGMKCIVVLLFVRFFLFGTNLSSSLVCVKILDMVLIWSFNMTYIFRLITGSLDVRLDFDLPITSTSLLDAVKQAKQYVADNFNILVIISYWYLVQFDDGTLLPRCMSDNFYERYVLEDN